MHSYGKHNMMTGMRGKSIKYLLYAFHNSSETFIIKTRWWSVKQTDKQMLSSTNKKKTSVALLPSTLCHFYAGQVL